jgi:hypothetical protein
MAFYVSGGGKGNIGSKGGTVKRAAYRDFMNKCTGVRLFAGGGGFGFGWLFVEFAAGHTFGGGFDFAFAEKFVVGR